MTAHELQAAPEISPSPDPSAGDDDFGHLVCCRDPAWLGGTLRGLCGAEGNNAATYADQVCSMCIEEAQRLRPGIMSEEEEICPLDGRACPDDFALMELVARRVLPE